MLFALCEMETDIIIFLSRHLFISKVHVSVEIEMSKTFMEKIVHF